MIIGELVFGIVFVCLILMCIISFFKMVSSFDNDEYGKFFFWMILWAFCLASIITTGIVYLARFWESVDWTFLVNWWNTEL